MTRVVCRELAPAIGQLPINLATVVGAAREGVAMGGEVVVFPELATSGYAFRSRAEAASTAIEATDPVFSELAQIAASGPAIFVVGFCELGADGELFNSAALVDGSGVRGVYRKTHLWDTEKKIFRPGAETPVVIDTFVGRIGVLICYDLEFPEMPRSLALAGADLIAVPTNWPLSARPFAERPPEVNIAMAAARVNRVPIACCDRCGTERGITWTEGTSIIGVDGWVVTTKDGKGWASAELDLGLSRDKTLSDRNDALADRRPELYVAVGPQI